MTTGEGGLDLDLAPGRLAIGRLAPDAPLPAWAADATGPLVSATRTEDELSLVLPEGAFPADMEATGGWRALAVRGPLEFTVTGILSSLAGPLAAAGIPIFVVSTFDTDWVLVDDDHLDEAISVLQIAGHRIHRTGTSP